MEHYGNWPESGWTSDAIDWKQVKELSAGVDVGTTSAQAAILADGALFGYANIRVGASFASAAEDALRKAAGSSGLSAADMKRIGATGFGRDHVKHASAKLSEVLCHAKGARFMFGPSVMTVADLGGQNTKAMLLYDWDRLRDFKLSDKCAAGMGRHIEEMCDLLETPITEIGSLSLDVANDPEPVSTTCYNFAYPEAVGLFRPGYKEAMNTGHEVLAAYLFSAAWRILGCITKLQSLEIGDFQVEQPIAFTGGLAKNEGVTKRLERELSVNALTSEYDPQLAGAIGAALLV